MREKKKKIIENKKIKMLRKPLLCRLHFLSLVFQVVTFVLMSK